MNIAEESALAEKAKAEELIELVPRIPEVDRITIRPHEDWSGEPSLYLTFHLKPEVVFDDDFFRRFNKYARLVQRKIQDGGVARFPYTELREAA